MLKVYPQCSAILFYSTCIRIVSTVIWLDRYGVANNFFGLTNFEPTRTFPVI